MLIISKFIPKTVNSSALSSITDKDLLMSCKKWGMETLEARRKFAGLLPEVNKRENASLKNGLISHGKSWLGRHGFTSIYHFAAKLAGMSHEQVKSVLRLEKRFEDKPALHHALTAGKISANKLARVASIATVENAEHLATTIESLSQQAVETFVRDYKYQTQTHQENNQQNAPEGLRAQTKNVNTPHQKAKQLANKSTNSTQSNKNPLIEMQLDSDIVEELLAMREKGIDINAFLRTALQARQHAIADERETLTKKLLKKQEEKSLIGMRTSRYIPAKIRRLIRMTYGSKCAVPHCEHPSEQIHHEMSFAVNGNHNPHHLKPLCRAHHELAHIKDPKFHPFSLTFQLETIKSDGVKITPNICPKSHSR